MLLCLVEHDSMLLYTPGTHGCRPGTVTGYRLRGLRSAMSLRTKCTVRSRKRLMKCAEPGARPDRIIPRGECVSIIILTAWALERRGSRAGVVCGLRAGVGRLRQGRTAAASRVPLGPGQRSG